MKQKSTQKSANPKSPARRSPQATWSTASKRAGRQGRPASPDARKADAAVSSGAASKPTDPAAPPSAPELTDRQRRHLRGLAHELKPIIRLGGAGLTDAVATETARALHDHELIKVKAPGGDREARDTAFAELARKTGSALVYRIGNVAVLYRPRPDLSRILIPDA